MTLYSLYTAVALVSTLYGNASPKLAMHRSRLFLCLIAAATISGQFVASLPEPLGYKEIAKFVPLCVMWKTP